MAVSVHIASLERVAEDHEVILILLVTASGFKRGRGICVDELYLC